MMPSARRKQLELLCWTDEEVPTDVSGDPGRFRQILTNLVGNALKFTEQGEVFVKLSLEIGAAGIKSLRTEICDTGPGMSAEGKRRLFKSFSQVDSSTTRRYGGTGLGLAISKQLAELMGGTIGVESEVDRGSTFWFTMTIGDSPEQQTALANSIAVIREKRILVVDDNATARRVLTALLARCGARPEEARDASAALEKLRRSVQEGHLYDLVIIDHQMPDTDGLELAANIRQEETLSTLPLLLASAAIVREHRPEITRHGIAAVLQKPIHESTLRLVLQRIWGVGVASQPRLEESACAPCVDAARLVRILVVDDNIINQRLTVRMVEKLGYHAEVAKTGLEALKAAEHTRYDVILMDCQMPEMDGYEATRILRAREKGTGAHAPIIALTANALGEERAHCIAAGMDNYLSKPVRYADLTAMIRRYVL